MSSLTTNNITINKITSSNGKFSGDNASGRIELECLSSFASFEYIVIPLSIEVEKGGFFTVHLKASMGGLDKKITYNDSVDQIITDEQYMDLDSIVITGSKIKGISNKTSTLDFGDDYQPYFNLNEKSVKLKSFQFPKDSPDSIDCENIFANWNLQGELPELDDRISNFNGAFANTHITGKLPKLPKNLQSASNAFLNCSGLTEPSKELIQQFVTERKPYFDLNYENMVSGCGKGITSWFSVNCGGDHDIIEYLNYTSSRNASTTFPYIMFNLPRGLKDKHYVRAVFKNGERFSSFSNCLYCSRDVMGKGATLFLQLNGSNNRHRVDTNNSQKYISDNGKQDIRPSDFSIFTRNLSEAKLTKFFSTEVEEYSTSITTSSYQNTTKSITLFASQVAGVNATNQGKLSIAELDIWDDEGYLIRMRSQGTSMVNLVSGTIHSSYSGIPFVTENVEIRDVDKEDLLFWEKFSGKTLPLNFWDEYSIALADYKANPTKTEEWTVQFDKPTGTFSSNCPYFDVAPTKPLVNLFLTKVKGFAPGYNTSDGKFKAPRSPFSVNTNQIMFFPNATDTSNIISMLTALQHCPITPKGNDFQGCRGKNIELFANFPTKTSLSWTFTSSYLSRAKLIAPKVKTMSAMFIYSYAPSSYLKEIDFEVPNVEDPGNSTYGCMEINYAPVEKLIFRGGLKKLKRLHKLVFASSAAAKSSNLRILYDDDPTIDVSFDSATSADTFASDRNNFDQVILLPKLSSATNAFLNTGMSARNIAKTLNSLPKWTDGKPHTITFTGCPGIEWEETTETFNGVANCPKFTKDTEGKALRKAFAKAVTNGWTVEIGTSTNAASTMSLRRLQYYKKTESECGDYVDSEGKTYIISTGDAFGPGGKNQDYEQFSSLEECLESWNLTEVVREEPVPFEEFIEEEQLDELENGTENFEEIASENDAS